MIVLLNMHNFNRHTKLMYCFYCFLALQLINYLQNSIDIATEQSFRYMELTDAKICISKIHHYIEFLQIGSHMYVYTHG